VAVSAAQMASYIYPENQLPEEAFSWWLSPCGGSNLVPDEIKKVYDILNQIPTAFATYKAPKHIKKGSGRKGDKRNPINRPKPRESPRPPPNECAYRPPSTHERVVETDEIIDAPPKKPCPPKNPSKKKPKCRIAKKQSTSRVGYAKHTYRMQSCVNDKTKKEEMIITSLIYEKGAKPSIIKATCLEVHSQACYHYSSAIRVNPHWAILTCPQKAAITNNDRMEGATATKVWSDQHSGKGWIGPRYRANGELIRCDRDEFPPSYFLHEAFNAYKYSGKDSRGQLVRYLPRSENSGAGRMWKGACFRPVVLDMSNDEFLKKFKAATKRLTATESDVIKTYAEVVVTVRPEFTIDTWERKALPKNDGLEDNECWPSEKAALDPGFALLEYDPYYAQMKNRPYDYRKEYVKGSNGS